MSFSVYFDVNAIECVMEGESRNRTDSSYFSGITYRYPYVSDPTAKGFGRSLKPCTVYTTETKTGLAKSARDCYQNYALNNHGAASEHYTIVFNTFVMMTLFNEFNSRKLRHEWNIFDVEFPSGSGADKKGCRCGFFDNMFFVVIIFISLGFQIMVVQIPGLNEWFTCKALTLTQWGICMAFAAGTFPVQWIINIVSRLMLGLGLCAKLKAVDTLVPVKPKTPEEIAEGLRKKQAGITKESENVGVKSKSRKSKLSDFGNTSSQSKRISAATYKEGTESKE